MIYTHTNIILNMSNMSNMSNMYNIYNESRNGETFDFMDGPPFVTGKLHMGHLAVGSIKDSFLKFKNMSGFACNNKLGYDCHGVPIESIANRELEIKSNEDLEKIGIEKFNNFCKETIRKFEKDWEPVYNKIGRLANFDSVYKTMDPNFMESIWWAFSELYKKKMIYRGYKVVAYSYPLQSPLSNSEESQNYKNVQTKTLYVRFKIISETNTYVVAWTTTPWTLPANVALCVNKDLLYEYVLSESGDIYILGQGTHKNAGIKVKEIIKTVPGSELVGLRYEPVFSYYSDETYFQIVEDNYVQTSEGNGTSIVHLAPTFGEDDYRVCIEKKVVTIEKIRSLDPIDENCKYNPVISDYAGKLVFDANDEIMNYLRENKKSIKLQNITHQYPYCYRTETPLIYRVCESFYVDVNSIKNRMIDLNKEINWYPSSVGSGRFNLWLEGARDWCVSRSRYFGTPIPVWISPSKKIIVIDSIETLYKYSNIRVTDLHPEIVNNIEFEYEGELYTRVKDVFDCWFESGCVPFAQHHYPFENKEMIDSKKSLSEFIVEGIDQTRGWFYTLLVLSTALFDKKPADNIMAVGLVLGENGKKISKKDGNFIDPNILIDNYRADSIRLYLLQSPLSTAEPFAFKENDLNELKQLLYGFGNAADFLLEHTHNMSVNGVQFDINAYKNTTNAMDRWIMKSISQTAFSVIEMMNSYEIASAVRKIIAQIENIRNWYLKFNRDRFKGKCGNEEWIQSTSVLNWVIMNFIKILAPFAPFVTEEIKIKLNNLNFQEKHIIQFEYTFEKFEGYEMYIDTFNLLQRISRLVRNARIGTKTHTSSKTPIKECIIYTDSDTDIQRISDTIDLIQTELNIIDISYKKLSENISYKVIPDMKILGKKYKSTIKKIQTQLESIKFNDKIQKPFEINIDGNTIQINGDEYKLEPVFSENDYFDKDIMVKIDFTYDKEIENMFNLKKFVSLIQKTRKEMGLHVWNKISIEIEFDDFGIVKNNINYMKERLECEVNLCSDKKADKFYETETDSKKIGYSVFIY
jgi:isoleucyl-tRNA synthetase